MLLVNVTLGCANFPYGSDLFQADNKESQQSTYICKEFARVNQAQRKESISHVSVCMFTA